MRIGWRSYEPGLCGDDMGNTKVGSGAWTRYIWNVLRKAGHTPVWVEPRRTLVKANKHADAQSFFDTHITYSPQTPHHVESIYDIDDIIELDTCFFYYRWPMPFKPERQYAYLVQQYLFKLFAEARVPFIVFDGDMMLTDDAYAEIVECGGQVVAPHIFPKNGVKTLFFPNPYKGMQLPLPLFREKKMTYVGNDYGRFDQACSYFSAASTSFKVEVYGDWIEKRGEDFLSQKLPYVEFKGRLSQDKIPDVMSSSQWTVHLFKPEYGSVGHVTMRWVEAAMFGCAAIIPREFANVPNLVGYSTPEVITSIMQSRSLYKAALESQREFVIDKFTDMAWIAAFEMLHG